MQNTDTNNINNNNNNAINNIINESINNIDIVDIRENNSSDNINNESDNNSDNSSIKDLGGRPKIQIDKKTFEGLCFIQATKDEICSVFNIDEKTLTRWCKDTYKRGFSDVLKEKSAGGKSSLRRAQWQSAQKGNVVMQIWLGKNWLDQRDKVENTNNTENHASIINVNFGGRK